MKPERAMLIVSCRPENRKTRLRMFDELSINSYVAPTIRDARELLTSQSLFMVFCALTGIPVCLPLRIRHVTILAEGGPRIEKLPTNHHSGSRCK